MNLDENVKLSKQTFSTPRLSLNTSSLNLNMSLCLPNNFKNRASLTLSSIDQFV